MSPRRTKKTDKRQVELPLTETPTLGMLFNWYEKALLAHQKRNTQKAYATSMRQTLAKFGEHAKPNKGQLHAWLSERVGAAEILPSTANVLRDHLHHIYASARDLRWPLVLNAAAFPRFPEAPKRPEGLKAPYRTWPLLVKAMPDARAGAFLSLQRWEGLRVSEVLGLEWRHVRWEAEGGPELLLEQQRDRKATTPGTLKNDSASVAMPLSEETVKLLREVRRELMKGRILFGSTRGALVGAAPCEDGAVRSYVFPYFGAHLDVLARRMSEACPEEFPAAERGVRSGKAFHRLRHTFGTETVTTVGVETARRLLRHKFVNTTALYADAVRGQQLDKAALAKVRQAAQQKQQQADEEASRDTWCGRKPNVPGGSKRQ